MEELTLKHIGRRLAHDLKIYWEASENIYGITFDENTDFVNNKYPLSTLVFTLGRNEPLCWKPILRPLSDITKPITHKGETFTPIERIYNMSGHIGIGTTWFKQNNINALPYLVIEWLLENHFVLDEPECSWIDVNTLPENPYK